MKILVAGDFCDKYRVTELIRNKEYSKMFGTIKNVVTDADFSFVNFEFPIVANECKPIVKCGPNLKGQPEAVDAIKWAGFNCCTLANNHILDQGEACLLDTKSRIEDAGMKTVGAGSNITEASKILYLEKDNKKLAVINCCEHEFTIATDTTSGANPLNPIQQYYKIREARQKADHVLVIVHGGHEHYQLPSPRMKETYRFFVDVGADAVVNHHQHCYSGYEVYNGKPIFYGLGNFLFDWDNERNSIWNEGYMVELYFNETLCFNLVPYIQSAEEATILLMNGDKKVNFEVLIAELNAIIADNERLKEMHKRWISRQFKNYRPLLCPYKNRILASAWHRGWLNGIISKTKVAQWLNYIDCESHRDVVHNFLQNNL